MTKYASQLPDFSDLLQASAQSKKLPSAIIEKDYFLTRALHALVEAHSGQFILKGGTSLSKGWQLLRRFSEDIDLLLKSESDWGKSRKDTRLKALEETIAHTEEFTHAEKVREAERGVHRTVVFAYASITNDLSGLSKTIRLEMGYRGQPAGAVRRSVQSMVAEFVASRGQVGLTDDLKPFEIDLQSASRTFVEKLFAAYAAYELNRAAGKARHYYDLYELCGLEDVRAFAGTREYRQIFAEAKDFAREFNSPVPAGDSFVGCQAFEPSGEDLRRLEQSYKQEANLFFSEAPTLADVLARIGALLPSL